MKINYNNEFFLVKFPIVFPIIYGIILFVAPKLELYLIFLTILILGETHFGATWPFFLNNVNKKYIKENITSLIFVPIIVAILSLIGFIFFKKTFLLFFFAANVFHVTRQSFGICKLYLSERNQLNFQVIFIYLFNFLFFLIGIFRFYFPIISENKLIILNGIVLTILITTILIYIRKFKSFESFYPFITGLIIFYPICFVNSPVHAIIMGVTMHYVQYLYLTYKVFEGRKKNKDIETSTTRYLILILLYSLAMSVFSFFGKNTNEIINSLIIIPIIGQMLHFYLDSQLWKFSNDHNRNNVLLHLIKKS